MGRAQASFATLTAKQSSAATSSQAAVVNLTSTQGGSTAAAAATTGAASSIYQQLQAYRQQRQADLAQLGRDLQTGDLNAAQQDFNTLTALGQSGPYKNGQTFARADRTQDFQAIGQALQSGDLAGAQSAFASLAGTLGQQDQQAQTAISAYNSVVAEVVINFGSPSGTNTSNPSTAPEIVVNLGQGSGSSSGTSGATEIDINLGAASSTSASGGSTTPEIIVNLGQGSNPSPASNEVTINLGNSTSGAQVAISETQGKNVSSAEQVTINLNQTKNYELILNLLSATAVSQAQSNSSNALSVQA